MGPIVWGFRYLQRKTTYTFSNLVLESLAEKRLKLMEIVGCSLDATVIEVWFLYLSYYIWGDRILCE